MRPLRRAASGLTLLELLVAVTILGVALVSMLGLHARNLRLAAEAQDLTVAAMLASRVAAEIQAHEAPPVVGIESGRFSDEASRLSFVGADVYGGDLAGRFAWRREVDPLGALFLRVRVVVGTEEREDLADLVFVRRGNLPGAAP
ncbi:MAG: prepilin-type N-terminal cleavage/methylation domain-containing protein [Myxococcales bacterium]|jgi:prepilin-type N-terminal cleavage/methylation domain-containing protein|nr:MAG: prepilin-type N-terminal cleavage/methylation domain-containing protein [Myxococcales bacterium]